MFENNFNSKKVDPLVEAARQAMVDGQIRRDAIAAVNEEFGVYNRNALVREQVSAYDARIEEAVKCMKEGKPLSKAQKAKMDVDDDNDIDADDLAKLRSMKEGTAEAETSMNVTMDKKPSTPAQTNAATSGPSAAEKSALTSKIKALKEAKKDIAKGGVTAPKDWSMPRGPNKGAVTKAPVPNESILEDEDKKAWKKAKKEFKEEWMKALEEAKYSAEAGRAGEDLGKRGKNFKKIAQKAAAKYGSEEAGERVAGAVLKNIRAKRMEEDSSFNSALETGKSVNEAPVDMTAFQHMDNAKAGIRQSQPARPGMARVGNRFFPNAGRSASATAKLSGQTTAGSGSSINYMNKPAPTTPSAGATPTPKTPPNVSGGMSQAGKQAASQSVKSNIAKGLSSAAGKDAVATAASRAPAVAGRIAGLAARANPVVGAAMAGAAASDALRQVATGTETGRAIGRSIGRAINPPVSTLPKTTPAANKAPVAPKGTTHTDTTLNSTGTKIQSRKSAPGYQDAGKWENQWRDKADSKRTIRQGKLVAPEVEKGMPSASSEKSTQSFMNKQLGRTTANAQGPEVPAKVTAAPKPPAAPKALGGNKWSDQGAKERAGAEKSQAATMKAAGDTPNVQTGTAAPKAAPTPPSRPTDLGKTAAPANVPTPPSRPAELDLPKIDKGPAPGPASVPNPKVNAPTPPASSERPAPAPMQNPDQNRTKVMKEEVEVGGNIYRIV